MKRKWWIICFLSILAGSALHFLYDYDKLTPEEFVTQINILKKSEHLKSPNNQRGKAVPYA